MSGGARRAGLLSQGSASREGSMCEGAAVASMSMSTSVVVLVSVPHYRWRWATVHCTKGGASEKTDTTVGIDMEMKLRDVLWTIAM